MSSIIDKIFEDLDYFYDEKITNNDCGRVDPRRMRSGEAENGYGEKSPRHAAQPGAAQEDKRMFETPMTLKRKPVCAGDRNLYVLQRERSALGLRWWADVCDIHGMPLVGDEEYVKDKERHLMSGGVVVNGKR